MRSMDPLVGISYKVVEEFFETSLSSIGTGGVTIHSSKQQLTPYPFDWSKVVAKVNRFRGIQSMLGIQQIPRHPVDAWEGKHDRNRCVHSNLVFPTVLLVLM